MQSTLSDSTLPALLYDPGSYRDRHGRVFYENGAIYRAVSERALAHWQCLSVSKFFRQACDQGKIVATQEVDASQDTTLGRIAPWAGLLRHQLIPFVSYPYEWSFGMLQDAALLQLDLLAAALEEDFILKDGSAYNVQWFGAQPAFIDIPSFERLEPGEPWAGYRQFCQTMLYPLLLQAHKNVPFHPWLRGSLEGIEPKHCLNLMSWRDLLRRGVFSHVFLHAHMQSRYGKSNRNIKEDLRSAGFHRALIQANVKRLQQVVRGLSWRQSKSTWSNYAQETSYSDSDQSCKEAFVRSVIGERRRPLVWDLGANTGHYSRIAAANSDYVVALDGDQLAVERLYQSLKAENCRTILPLVGNLIDASPNLGWRGTERRGLLERGRPQLVLCLALIHHVVISANVPMAQFIAWLSDLGADLIIEFVDKNDPMVQTLLRNKRDDYSDYEIDMFERCLQESFTIARREQLHSGTRTLYHAVHESRARL